MGKLNAANLMSRIEVMMERGQVFAEPVVLSGTDTMLDALLARSNRRAASGATQGRNPPRSSRTSGPDRKAANWLNLPSLEELIDTRCALLDGNAKGP